MDVTRILRWDALLDEMEGMLHSPDDPRYVELARQAMELFLRDMPVIHIAEELHVIVHNTHYWQGWPGVEDPYVAPYPPWNGWYLITLNLEPDRELVRNRLMAITLSS